MRNYLFSAASGVLAVLGMLVPPMHWAYREVIEIGAAIGLVLGVGLGAVLMFASPETHPQGRGGLKGGVRRFIGFGR